MKLHLIITFNNVTFPSLALHHAFRQKKKRFDFRKRTNITFVRLCIGNFLSFDMVEDVSSNIPQSSCPARLSIFEDDEAVIRMISKG